MATCPGVRRMDADPETLSAGSWIMFMAAPPPRSLGLRLNVPGLDYENLTPDLVTSLAVVTDSTTGRVRWSRRQGPCRHGHSGYRHERDESFDRLGDTGAILAKYLFYPLATRKALRYNAWARERGIRMKVRLPAVCAQASARLRLRCSVMAQARYRRAYQRGPIPMSDDEYSTVIDRTDFALEICSSGNYGSTQRAVRATSRIAGRCRV